MEKLIARIQRYIENHPSDPSAYNDLFDLFASQSEGVQQRTEWNERNRTLRGQMIQQMGHHVGGATLSEFVRLQKKSLLIDTPVDFDAYMQFVEFERDPEKRFYLPRRKVMRSTVADLQRLIDDELDLLSISMPPGTGKSTLGIFLLSWVMGRWPDKPNLASAHADLLTRSFFDGVISIITDPEYAWSDAFPTRQLGGRNSKEETIDIDKPHRFSTLTCRAINASLTGATRCEGVLYADDLVSGIEEAMSKDRMDSLWLKYTNDLKSRKKEKAKELHIATRWSIHDVIGRLERMYSDDPRAKFIVLPALNERDESNFDYPYNVGFSTKYFHDMRDNLDDASFRALFQNEPVEREGVLYHGDELRRYFRLPEGQPDAIIAICDTKDTGKDYAFLPVAMLYGQDYYIADCICDNGKPETVQTRIAHTLVSRKVQMCRFESNSAGGHVAKDVHEDVQKMGGITEITTKFTTSNKETRIIVNSPWVKQHCLFLDKTGIRPGSDYKRMMDMLTGYTMMGKNPHDDVPDGMAMLAEFAQSLAANRVEVVQRPF